MSDDAVTNPTHESSAAPARPEISETRNRWTFSIGTLGRDMVYTLQAMFLIVYLTEVLDLPDATMWWINGILLGARLFDAFTDIIMGGIVDNTRTRWGSYKPWIVAGAVASAICTVLLFTDTGLSGGAFIAFFAVVYVLWGLSWTTNDIPYWSLLPALSLDRHQRERIAATAKVFATIGMFIVVVAVIPVTNAMGGNSAAWSKFVIAAVVIMLVAQSVTVFGVREPQIVREPQSTSLREIARAVLKNDQLLWVSVAMLLFYTGYTTTTAFGVYFFKYAYGNEDMFAPFAAVLGVAQLVGYALFPVLRRKYSRRFVYTLATSSIVLGYVVFFFSPMNMIPIGIAGLLLFVAQASIVLLLMVFMTDCIEYGQWKLGKRSTAVTFALQPFVVKVASALANAMVGATVIVTGINMATGPADVSAEGIVGMKVMMMFVPLLLIVAGYLIYLWKYRIDEGFHARIVADLKERGELA